MPNCSMRWSGREQVSIMAACISGFSSSSREAVGVAGGEGGVWSILLKGAQICCVASHSKLMCMLV